MISTETVLNLEFYFARKINWIRFKNYRTKSYFDS